nr:hypothetical protein [Tanacetum cinerariifolium]
MSTRSNSSYPFSPLRDLENLIRRSNLGEPSSLFDFDEVMNNNHNQDTPPAGPPPQNNNGPPPMVRPNGQAPQSIGELCQPSINGRGGLIASIPIQATDFGLRHHMIQEVQNTCQFHGLPGDDANRHIDKFIGITYETKRVTQIDMFYNGLTLSHRDTINAAAGGTFMQMTSKECYELIENMTAHHNHWDTLVIRDETSRNISSTSTTESPEVFRQLEMMNKNFLEMIPSNELTNYMKSNEAILRDMRTQMTNMKTEFQNEFKSMIDARTNKIETQNNQIMNILTNMQMQNSSVSGPLPSNTIANPRGDLKAITTQSGVFYDGPPIPPPTSSLPNVVERVPEVTKDTIQPSTKTSNLRNLHFNLSFADAHLHIPKSALMFKSLLNNKEKLFDLAKTPVNENCSAVILKKLPEKLEDPGKFLIPCDFSNFLCPKLLLEFADRSTTRPADIVVDVFVKVGKFHFPTDFVVIDYVVDPRVPLILGRPFLSTGRALIDVYGEELTLRVDDEAITFKVGQTSKYSYCDADDFILEDIKTFLQTPDEFSNLDDDYYDTEGDILYLENLLNEDPSHNLPPLSLPELTSTQMILELADRLTTRLTGIAEDVLVKVGKFHFPTDFVFIDYVVDPRVPLILRRPFLWTGRALIDVYGEELTLRVDD